MLLVKCGGVSRALRSVPLLMSRSAIHCQHLLTCSYFLTMFSSLTHVVRHIDSLTSDYHGQSTIWVSSFASSNFAECYSRRRWSVQADRYSMLRALRIIWRCSSGFQGAVRVFRCSPTAFNFPLQVPSLTLRTDEICCQLLSLQLSPRDAHSSSIAQYIFTCHLHHNLTA